jgi:hypothetical protein
MKYLKYFTCKNCHHWVRHSENEPELGEDRGKCFSRKFVDISNPNSFYKREDDTLEMEDHEIYGVEFTTGENFGCVHFKMKDDEE